MDHIGNCVLDIPVPKSVRGMRTVPPVCLSKFGDLRILDLIRDFGQEFDCSHDEIAQALNLASGPSDVMIILERPSDSHDYTLPAEEFVRKSPTLRAVDELIKFSTKGARSIYTVSVVDAFMFKPKQRPMISDQRCHQLLAQMIRLKKPKVLLVCHTKSYSDPWMQKFQLPCNRDYKMSHKIIGIGTEAEINVVQSFHPSTAVNHRDLNPEYKVLLLHHFLAAFSLLHGPYNEPSVVETIRSICAKKGDNRKDLLKSWEAADRISNALNPSLALSGVKRLGFADENEREKISREKNSFDDMYKRLLQLSESPQPVGALSISEVVIYLWKERFRLHPLYKQVMTMLTYRGNEQECWKNHASFAEPIEDKFSRMNLEDTRLLKHEFDRPITKSDSAAIFNISNAHAHHAKERQILKDKLRGDGDPTLLLPEMIRYVEEDCLIEKNLTNCSIYNLSSSLRICRLVSEIRFQIKILRMDDFVLKDVEDFIDAGDRLERLIMTFRGNS